MWSQQQKYSYFMFVLNINHRFTRHVIQRLVARKPNTKKQTRKQIRSKQTNRDVQQGTASKDVQRN